MAEEAHGTKATIEVAGEAYDVLYARVDERLDEVPRLEARLWKDGELPRPKALLDSEVVFQIGSIEAFDSGRKFKGTVTEAERRFDTAGRPFVRIVVCPALFKTTKRTDVRTFQKLKVDEIVQKVADTAGFKAKFSLVGSYEPRDYVVQYRETDFDFLRRLLSEEGVGFAVDHEADEVVFFDDPHGLGDAPEKTLTYRAEFGFEQAEASVFKVKQIDRVVSDKIFMREYDPKRPRFNVEGEAESADDGEHGLETYVFPARSVKEATAKRYAQVLLDAIQCRRDIVDAANAVNDGDGVILLTDMFGGTPSNLAISVMEETQAEVIAGLNLPMLIKLASVRGREPLEACVAHAQDAGRKYISVASWVLQGEK